MRFKFLTLWVMLIGCAVVINARPSLLYRTLKEGTGIRAMSMGGAYTAVAEESSAFGYNPAGLAVPGGSFRTDNYDYNSTQSTAYGGNFLVASPMGFGQWSREVGGEKAEVTAIGFGRRTAGVDIGVLYKMISATGGPQKITGWSADFGILFRIAPYMDIGVVGQDLLQENSVDIPATIRSGVAFFNPEKSYYLTADVVFDRINGVDETHVHSGLEYRLTDGVILRCGWQQERFNGGIGLAFPLAEIEYGFISDRSGSKETIYQLGFKFGRGASREAPKRQRRYAAESAVPSTIGFSPRLAAR